MQDVLFVFFKHKWLILILSFLGFGSAAAVYFAQAPLFQSQAKLLVRYVIERSAVDPYQAQASPGASVGAGNHVIGTEMEILNSADLAIEVAEAIGPDRLLPKANGNIPPSAAVGVILSNLQVIPGLSTNVLHVHYKNEDPELAKEVLRELVDRYFNKHLEIHRSAAAFDIVSKQAEELRERLEKTEAELNMLRTESGIVSMTDATEALSSQRARTREDLMRARAELAEQQASIQSLEKAVGGAQEAKLPTRPENEKPSLKPVHQVPPQVITEYRAVMELIAFLQKRELELRIKFKTGNRLLVQNQQQIANYEGRRQALLEEYPALSKEAVVIAADPKDPRRNLDMEKARLAAITAKVQVFEEHLKEISAQFSQQYAIGAAIDAVERRRQMEETEYRTLEVNLKNARVDQTLDPSRMPNITVVQQPTEPIKIYDTLTKKIILGLAAGGLALGLGIAFLIEFVFNRKIDRPIEIQARLQLPLLLSIPFIRKSERGGLLLGRNLDSPRIGMDQDEWIQPLGPNGFELSATSAKMEHFILPYSETIRDRIIFNFEVNNVIHKPKLVAVTGMSEGAGTSTIAAGLAKSFSEINGVKVLLVDLSSLHPQENPLFGEIPRHSLPNALKLAKDAGFREQTQNLYYANAPSRRDDSGSTFTPLHLHQMMPMLHASEYDYIIFDMPPVDQTSRTLTMAGLMDKVLLVLDAENTSRDGLKWGYSELTKGRADVSCIFNKTRTHGPDWLLGGN